jgi:hypothetical protein
MKSIRVLLVFPCLMGICRAAATSDSPTAAQRWVSARFLGVAEPAPSGRSFLETRLKPNALIRNCIEGHPLLIVDQKFDNGIAMRSPGEIVVRLSSSVAVI